jgi:hypothetical protein
MIKRFRRRRGRHAWKGSVKRNDYALINSSKLGWVRVFWFGPDDFRLLPLDFML